MSELMSCDEKSSSSPSEQLKDCLNNLFHGPNQSLERAFNVILEVVKVQEEEHANLNTAFKSLQDTHWLTKDYIRDELNTNYKRIRDELNLKNEKNAAELKESLIKTKLQRDQLLETTDKLARTQNVALKDIRELRQDIKVIAYNLQGCDEGEWKHNLEELDIKRSNPNSQTSETEKTKGSSETRTTFSSEAEDCRTEDKVSQLVENGPTQDEQCKELSSTGNEGEDIFIVSSDKDALESEKSIKEKVHENTSSKVEDKRIGNFPALDEQCEEFRSVEDKELKNISVSSDKIALENKQKSEGKVNEDIFFKVEDCETENKTLQLDKNNKESPSEVEEILMVSNEEGHILPNVRSTQKKKSTVSLWKGGVRKISSVNVSKQKLEKHETMGVRLDKIEEESDSLKKEVVHLRKNIKSMVEQENCKDGIQLFEQRIVNVEDFLNGFGICNEDNPNAGIRDIEEGMSSTGGLVKQTHGEELKIVEGVIDSTESSETVDKIIFDSEKVQKNFSQDQWSNRDLDSTVHQSKETRTNSHIPSFPLLLSNKSTYFAKSDPCRRKSLMSHLLFNEKNFEQNISNITRRLNEIDGHLRSANCATTMQSILSNVNNDSKISINDEVEDLALRKCNDEQITNECNKLRTAILHLSQGVDTKVSKSDISRKIQLLTDTDIPISDINEEGRDEMLLKNFRIFLHEELNDLRSQKVDKNMLSNDLNTIEEKISGELSKGFSDCERQFMDIVGNIQREVEACKDHIHTLHEKLNNTKGTESASIGLKSIDVDEQIKYMTNAVQSSLEEVIASRLEHLKTFENELENFTSQLAEKPNQDQINDMIKEFENSFTNQDAVDGTIQSILDSMRSELGNKMTRVEVLSLVKHIIHGVKEDIRNNSDSLMVGCRQYKCLGCDQLFPGGVNSRLARKVNHNALPSSISLAPSVITYSRSGRNNEFSFRELKKRPNILKPLSNVSSRGCRPQTTCEILMRRSSSLVYKKKARNKSR